MEHERRCCQDTVGETDHHTGLVPVKYRIFFFNYLVKFARAILCILGVLKSNTLEWCFYRVYFRSSCGKSLSSRLCDCPEILVPTEDTRRLHGGY